MNLSPSASRIIDTGDRVRVLVLGDRGVGKSSLIHMLCHHEPLRVPRATIGFHVDVKVYERRKKRCWVELLEVAGASKHVAARRCLYGQADGVLLVYDPANRRSYEHLWRWMSEATQAGAFRDTNATITATGGSGSSSAAVNVSASTTVHRKSQTGYDVDLRVVNGGSASHEIPVLLVGTMADRVKPAEHRRRYSIVEEFDGDYVHLCAIAGSNFVAGSPISERINAFFDRVIERKFFEHRAQRPPSPLHDLSTTTSAAAAAAAAAITVAPTGGSTTSTAMGGHRVGLNTVWSPTSPVATPYHRATSTTTNTTAYRGVASNLSNALAAAAASTSSNNSNSNNNANTSGPVHSSTGQPIHARPMMLSDSVGSSRPDWAGEERTRQANPATATTSNATAANLHGIPQPAPYASAGALSGQISPRLRPTRINNNNNNNSPYPAAPLLPVPSNETQQQLLRSASPPFRPPQLFTGNDVLARSTSPTFRNPQRTTLFGRSPPLSPTSLTTPANQHLPRVGSPTFRNSNGHQVRDTT